MVFEKGLMGRVENNLSQMSAFARSAVQSKDWATVNSFASKILKQKSKEYEMAFSVAAEAFRQSKTYAKPSETAIKDNVRVLPAIVESAQARDEAELLCDYLNLLMKAIENRSRMLEITSQNNHL